MANIALILGNYNINNIKLIGISLVFSALSFVIMNLSGNLNSSLSFLLDNFSYMFLIVSVVIFLLMLFYTRNAENNLNVALVSILAMFLISMVMLSSQSGLDLFNMILYSLCVFITLFCVYQLTKLLHHAKRQYPVIIGEYMCLFAILVFIFALTYNSTRSLDYSMFSPFLILTPTYQLIYIIIAIIVVLVVGVVLNDKGGSS